MAPGDLNLKKSWFPKLMKNQAKVWQMEQDALQEHKKIKERQKEFEKEKERKELIDLQIKNDPHLKTKLLKDRIEWMYDDPTKQNGNGSNILDEEEDYLLGKKRIDNLLLNKDKIKIKSKDDKNDRLARALAVGQLKSESDEQQQQKEEEFQISERDALNKARDDPMMKLKLEQMKRLEFLKRQESSTSRSQLKKSDKDSNSKVSKKDSRHDSHKSHRHRHRHHHHSSTNNSTSKTKNTNSDEKISPVRKSSS